VALLNLPLDQLHLFFFVLARVSAMLFTIPFLDARSVPMTVKAGLAVAFSLMLMPQLNASVRPVAEAPIALALGLIAEISMGLIMGLAMQLIFVGVQIAGETAGFQMGFAIANVMDPTSELQIPVLSQFLNLFALMLFLALDCHYYFIRVMAEAFERIPPWSVHFGGDLVEPVLRLTGSVFLMAVQIGAPVMASLLLTSVTLGIIARTVPQMQVFVVAMPLKIALGMLFLGIALPFCGAHLQSAFTALGQTLMGLVRILI
jgi:flagellar biosynthetic protein FliR